MVTFGKRLKESQIDEWQRYYISYKLLKKRVNHYTEQIALGDDCQHDVLGDFSKILDNQIEKIVLFLLEQQGQLATRLTNLAEQRMALLETPQRAVPDMSELHDMRDSYRDVGEDLLRLLSFVEMNAIGLRKILKKFDKRCGYKFTDYYVKTRADHPYSQLRQVFKIVGFSAIAGTICRNIAELHEDGDCLSMYDQPSLLLYPKDPVIQSITEAVKKLSASTSFLEFISKGAFIDEENQTETENKLTEQRYHFVSLLLNLMNTFLYMVNTYIIVPTADKYSMELGAAATVCGAVIGSMAFAQIFSSVYFSAWSNKSYLRPLLFSSVVLLIGNVMYALAYDLNSITVLIIGRVFCGLGSARAVNRRYISDCVPQKMRMKASAGFVSASALGMACGPALACLFQTRFRVYGVTFSEDTLPGWVMAFAWLVYLILVWFCFKEPSLYLITPQVSAGSSKSILEETGFTQPLLIEEEQDNDLVKGVDDADAEDDSACDSTATSIVAAYRLLTPSVKVQLLVYFMLKFSMEILLAESSVITGHYFIWTTRSVAVFLACLGLTVLPVNIVVGNYISNIFEERQILVVSEFILCIGIVLSFNVIKSYSVLQYVGSAILTFVAAEVLEGVNLSLLSRVMSSRLSRGTYNGGLLSTEAGTFARVIADGTITLAGYMEENMLLNVTLLPSLFICVLSIIATCLTYNSLY